MKAIAITSPGAPGVLEFVDRPTPVPAKNEVLIHVKAAGVNRPDIAQRKGSYPPPPGAPVDLPGLEVAGIVEVCGPDVRRWKKGDKVCALLAGGGYAEFTVVDAGQCLSMPHGLSYVEAASLPETVFTVWNNVFQRGALKPGENFLVQGGSSGIGITAIQLAKAFGATVFATAGSAEKCAACTSLGADECINYKEEDFEMALESKGVDVVLDMIGGDYVAKEIRLLHADGRLVFINSMKGNKVELNITDIMRKRLIIAGSTLRNRDILFKTALAAEVEAHVWPLIKSGKFKPVIYKTFSMQHAAKAHELMESSSHIGKIILVNED
ncbi:MAG TPA: NAD(P)H-quinone oxidoreductase [Hanamia sp.]|nr:NAD(P)H-quinone oxidoreductase [Hanamia sp.]